MAQFDGNATSKGLQRKGSRPQQASNTPRGDQGAQERSRRPSNAGRPSAASAISSNSGSGTVMQRTLDKLKDKKTSLVQKIHRGSGLIDYKRGDCDNNKKGRAKGGARFKSGQKQQKSWMDDDELDYNERQNSVGTLELFKYARKRESLAILIGILLMIYAASWQPISVFILAIMASLMGTYSKRVAVLKNLNSSTETASTLASVSSAAAFPAAPTGAGEPTGASATLPQMQDRVGAQAPLLSSLLSTSTAPAPELHLTHHHHHHHHQHNYFLINDTSGNYNPRAADQLRGWFGGSGDTIGDSSSSLKVAQSMAAAAASNQSSTATASYENYSFLHSLYAFVTPIFDFGHGTEGQQRLVDEDDIRAAVRNVLDRESTQFLRKSFEINGSAFILALTQLFAFFLGMTLITWAAKKQAARIKVFYFNSCLHQEVTWFEAHDSASGSGSSLNGLVDKFEDGIGMKFALLCYFLGHVALFTLTAFYQMFSLAAFCMPFVMLIGLIIAYLSQFQANSIGQHALFAKRSLQLAEEIIAAIRTVFAFNGQQKEITRYSMSLEPVYRKSLIKHLYTALNTSLSKFSIFACFSIYCHYARHLFPPYSDHATNSNKATILAIMRGAEVSIVNILISIPFLEALQQGRGSIARIFVAIERRSKINAASDRGLKLDELSPPGGDRKGQPASDKLALFPATANGTSAARSWSPTISFRMVQFGYADRSGPTTRRRSTLPNLCLTGAGGGGALAEFQAASAASRRRSVIEQIADEAIDSTEANSTAPPRPLPVGPAARRLSLAAQGAVGRRQSAVIRQMLGNEIRESRAAGGNVRSSRVLNNFTLEIKAGQSVALVGPSGSGKSTVLALVQRLYDASEGQLLVGQHDIKELNLAWLRSQIGLVGQEPRLFDMSIGENIMLGLGPQPARQGSADGKPAEQRRTSLARTMHGEGGEVAVDGNNSNGAGNDNSGDCDNKRGAGSPSGGEDYDLMQQVVEAAKAANAHDFISRLPNGYATRVGSAGVQLSGGQKQRIAIARALIRKPKILLLDECTSALDTESEAQVHAALKRASASAQMTTLIVAHRLDTIKHVDMIVVMNQGQVVACGTHEALMQTAEAGEGGRHLPQQFADHGADGDSFVAGARIYKQLYEQQQAALQQQQRQPGGARRDSVAMDRCILEEADEEAEEKQQLGEAASVGADLSVLAGFAGAKGKAEAAAAVRRVTYGAGFIEEENESQAADGGLELDNEDYDDYDEDDDYDDSASSASSASSSLAHSKPGAWRLWQFIEIPKWSTLISVLVCLLAGLILPLNLIAHSYLFSAFAYNELEQIGDYLHVFGLLILSFSAFVFIVSFLEIILPGYVGEKLSVRLRVKTMESLLAKPMFYFDMNSNGAGAICDRFNGYICNLQSIAGTRISTMLEAISTLAAGALFGFGQNLSLSLFCLSFAVLVLLTTIIESRIVERESSLQQRYDAQLAHLMADALSNIKTIASLNRESYFIEKFKAILKQRERSIGSPMILLHTFLTSFKFVMPAMSWSASMYYGSYLLVNERIDLQTIYIVCPVVLFAVNDTFRALVFLPELLKARKSIERLFKLHRDFSPEVLQTLTFGQQLEEQNRLHVQQLSLETCAPMTLSPGAEPLNGAGTEPDVERRRSRFSMGSFLQAADADSPSRRQSGVALEAPTAGGGSMASVLAGTAPGLQNAAKPKRSISFVGEPGEMELTEGDGSNLTPASDQHQVNRRLSNLSNLPTYMRRKSSRLNSLVPRINARGRIEFKRVDFAYPNRPTALVLDNFTLSIEPGESVALVGSSGSGKSTTVAVLEKFYDYHAGQITLDGHDLRLVEPHWVRSQIGLVQQEPCLLSYTIGDNIRYGDNGRFVTMDEVVEAARTANIHDFIMTLPDQYDTELSSSAYSSCQLSGGQRQRIAIARALVRNAPILIFDEATSALDNTSEQVVQDALRKAKRGRTNLTIAHRLVTVKEADKIVVMRDGLVVEMGKHEELLTRPGGFYKALWERQAVGSGAE